MACYLMYTHAFKLWGGIYQRKQMVLNYVLFSGGSAIYSPLCLLDEKFGPNCHVQAIPQGGLHQCLVWRAGWVWTGSDAHSPQSNAVIATQPFIPSLAVWHGGMCPLAVLCFFLTPQKHLAGGLTAAMLICLHEPLKTCDWVSLPPQTHQLTKCCSELGTGTKM